VKQTEKWEKKRKRRSKGVQGKQCTREPLLSTDKAQKAQAADKGKQEVEQAKQS
jgi:hypothetical protein